MFQGLEEIPCRSVGYVLRILGQNPTEDEIVEMVMKVRAVMMVMEVSKDMMVMEVSKEMILMKASKKMMYMKVSMEVSKASGIVASVVYLHMASLAQAVYDYLFLYVIFGNFGKVLCSFLYNF